MPKRVPSKPKAPIVRLGTTTAFNNAWGDAEARYKGIIQPEAPSIRLAHVPGAQGDNNLLGQRGVEQLPEESRPALLVSYVYLEPFLANKHRYAYRDWVLDSGAFSAHNSGVEIKLQDYINVCKRLLAEDPTLTEVFGLDVIGDWKAGLANCEEMWRQGVPAIPTFHHGEPWEVLLGIAKDYPKIALGGCVGKRDKDKFAGQCFARVWPKRIHGFGFGSEKSIMAVPFHSVDATNWELAPCLTGDCWISTPSGLHPISSLVGNELPVNTYEQISVPDCKVIRSGIKEVVRVCLRGGLQLKCTPNHLIKSLSGWQEAGSLRAGDQVRIIDRQLTSPQVGESPLDEMFGWMLGDGWLSSQGAKERPVVGILFAPDDEEAYSKLMPVWDTFVGFNYALQVQNGIKRKSCERQEVLAKLEELGFRVGLAPSKELPSYLYSASPLQQLTFLRGLFSADGTVAKSPNGQYNCIRLASSSKAVLRQVQIMLLEYGIQSRVYWSRPDLKRNEQGELNINGLSAKRYMQVIGFNLSAKSMKFEGERHYSRQAKQYDEVLSVEALPAEPVYDVVMPAIHHFVANGIVVHNCKYGTWKAFGHQRVSVRGSQQNLRAEVEWYLDLERRARERWKKEMERLESEGPVVRLAHKESGREDGKGILPRGEKASRRVPPRPKQ